MTTELNCFQFKASPEMMIHNVELKLFQIMMMSNNMENVAPHVIKNVSRQVKSGKCMFLYLYMNLYLYLYMK